MTVKKRTVLLVEECNGQYYLSDAENDVIDVRGIGFNTKADALRAAHRKGYTHVRGHFTGRIPERYRI